MSKKKLAAASLLSLTLLLTGCLNDSFKEEAARVKEKKEEIKKKEGSQDSVKANEDIYKQMEKPLDEVILENDLDTEKEVGSLQVTVKEEYKEPSEFAKYAGQILYQFYTQQITPEEYYDFLIKYGSSQVVSALPSKEDAINVLGSIQNMFKGQNITGDGYKLTAIKYDRLKRSATFYRKVLTTNGEEYFITTITKENNVWKYVEDGPSAPYTLLDNDQ